MPGGVDPLTGEQLACSGVAGAFGPTGFTLEGPAGFTLEGPDGFRPEVAVRRPPGVKGAAAIVSVSPALHVSTLLVALSVASAIPAAVGVPEISPVSLLIDRPAGSPVAAKVVADVPVSNTLLPGAGSPAAASSSTSTQSFPSGGVKLWLPLVLKVPGFVTAPVCGLNHQPCAVLVLLAIPAMLMVTEVAFPLGIYAIIVCPSELRDNTEMLVPDP